MKTPKITVLMPVHNGEKYLKEAIESILAQTFKNFEFLIINDGSNDRSVEIIKSYNDPRIKLIHNEKNIGLAETCNRGIKLARGEYIARMDCDDISLPERIKKQIKFMESHPDIGLCGTWIKTIGKISGYVNKYFSNPEDAKVNLLFTTSVAHPSVIIRKKILTDNNLKYNKIYEPGDDYELWTRLTEFTKISNIPEVLLLYRMHEKNISVTKSENQRKGAVAARISQLKKINITPSDEELLIHQRISKPKDYSIADFINKKESWLDRLKQQNNKAKYYKEPHFSKVISKQWLAVCGANTDSGFWIFNKFWKSPLSKNIKLTEEWKQIIKFFIKCLIKKSAD